MLRRRPGGFASPGYVEPVLCYGPNPAAVYYVASIDAGYGRRLAGAAGHVPIGDAQTRKATGELGAHQQFVGLAQLQNLMNAKIGLATAIPSTKPNPGIVPLSQMQSSLAQLASNR